MARGEQPVSLVRPNDRQLDLLTMQGDTKSRKHCRMEREVSFHRKTTLSGCPSGLSKAGNYGGRLHSAGQCDRRLMRRRPDRAARLLGCVSVGESYPETDTAAGQGNCDYEAIAP